MKAKGKKVVSISLPKGITAELGTTSIAFIGEVDKLEKAMDTIIEAIKMSKITLDIIKKKSK